MIGIYDYTVVLTYISVLSAVTGLALAHSGKLTYAVLALVLCGVLDLLDGPVARTKKNRTEEEKAFGIQIDSLNDMISFGVLPAAIGYQINPGFSWEKIVFLILPLTGLIRLAYYNVQESIRQKEEGGKRKYYTGLPITASAVIVPPVYLLRGLMPENVFYWLFVCIILLTASLYVVKIRVFKPGIKGVIFFAIMGALTILRLATL